MSAERPIGPRFIQISHHQRPETPTRTGNLPPIGRGYAGQASIQGHRSGLSTLPTSRGRRRGLNLALRCRLSAGGLAQDPAPGGVGKTMCWPAKQSWEADKVPPRIHRRTILLRPRCAPRKGSGPTSARSTKPSWRQISALERAAGETAVDHHAAKAARKHPDAGTVELFRGRVRG
jgi:hypothetical protein